MKTEFKAHEYLYRTFHRGDRAALNQVMEFLDELEIKVRLFVNSVSTLLAFPVASLEVLPLDEETGARYLPLPYATGVSLEAMTPWDFERLCKVLELVEYDGKTQIPGMEWLSAVASEPTFSWLNK